MIYYIYILSLISFNDESHMSIYPFVIFGFFEAFEHLSVTVHDL